MALPGGVGTEDAGRARNHGHTGPDSVAVGPLLGAPGGVVSAHQAQGQKVARLKPVAEELKGGEVGVDQSQVDSAIVVVVEQTEGSGIFGASQSGERAALAELAALVEKELVSLATRKGGSAALFQALKGASFDLVSARDRTPVSASLVYREGEPRRSAVESAQSVDIESPVVVEVGKLASPRPPGLVNFELVLS